MKGDFVIDMFWLDEQFAVLARGCCMARMKGDIINPVDAMDRAYVERMGTVAYLAYRFGPDTPLSDDATRGFIVRCDPMDVYPGQTITPQWSELGIGRSYLPTC